MKLTSKQPANILIFNIGYYISLFGSAIILLWIGIFKFTPSEAAAIESLIKNHPFTFWVYDSFSLQAVSNVVGVIEILTAVGLILSIFIPLIRRYVGVVMMVTFLTTLSYLFTTPNVWRIVDGVPVTDFFILKDLLLLGFGIMLASFSHRK